MKVAKGETPQYPDHEMWLFSGCGRGVVRVHVGWPYGLCSLACSTRRLCPARNEGRLMMTMSDCHCYQVPLPLPPLLWKALFPFPPPASSRPIDKWIKAVGAKQKISIITLINTADNCLKSPDNGINPVFCATAFFLRLNSLLPHPP